MNETIVQRMSKCSRIWTSEDVGWTEFRPFRRRFARNRQGELSSLVMPERHFQDRLLQSTTRTEAEPHSDK